MEKQFNEELFNFISASTCSFTCIEEISKKLIKNGYKQVYENEKWNLANDKYFVVRNDSSIIAFNIGKQHKDCFNIVCAHSDTPSFYLKPQSEVYENNYLKLNVSPYGGILNYSWMDKALSLSGRIILKKDNVYQRKIININKPLCVIPSEAIHQNSSANSNLDLNTQVDLIPIISLKEDKDIIKNILRNYLDLPLDVEICDYDLFLHTLDKPSYVGAKEEFILSPRLDDLTCTFAALKGFIDNDNAENINVMCIFSSEEIGSLTKEGADSSFLIDTLKRICASINLDIAVSLHNSLIICADNSHAVHPNHPSKSDISNQGYLNQGVLVIREHDTTTDSISSSIFKQICQIANVPYQDYTSRNDMNTGSTLSGLCTRHVSIDSIDVGISQLAMHSSNEVVGAKDTYYLYKVLKKYYDISIECNHNDVKINDNKNERTEN